MYVIYDSGIIVYQMFATLLCVKNGMRHSIQGRTESNGTQAPNTFLDDVHATE